EHLRFGQQKRNFLKKSFLQGKDEETPCIGIAPSAEASGAMLSKGVKSNGRLKCGITSSIP
ncbi:MAG: hypothetical protein IKL00_05235, partial [Oscillospiraceae bacterium]|nr:hypothetical protein [Oscillospiraceae bacterium]